MSRKILAHPAARAEVRAATLWYEGQREGLGWDFFWTADDAVRRAATGQLPALSSAVPSSEPNLRRIMLDRFPYTTYFLIEHADLIVLAFAHQKRRPGYWRRRSPVKAR